MSHIEKRTLKDGSVRYDVIFTDPFGRRKRKVAGRRKADATSLEKRIHSDIISGKYGKEIVSFKEHYDSWWKAKKRSLKPSTVKSYEHSFRNHILPSFEKMMLSEITPSTVQDWANSLSDKKGLSPATVNRLYRYLRSCLSSAVAKDLLNKNPCRPRAIDLPRLPEQKLEFLNPDEIIELLDILHEPDRTFIATLSYSGLRLGEGLALRWKNIDFEHGRISVERAYTEEGGMASPKTKASKRSVPLLQILSEILMDFYKMQGKPNPDDFLFSVNDKTPLDSSNLRKRYERALKAANLKKVDIHSLRHTYASVMLDAGVSIKALSGYLGHASVTMTLNTYAHLIREDQHALIRANTLFSGKKAGVVQLPRSTESS
jgi:integrase